MKEARVALAFFVLFFGTWCYFETSTCIDGFWSRNWIPVDGKVTKLVKVTRSTRLGGYYEFPVVEYEAGGTVRENRRVAFGYAWRGFNRSVSPKVGEPVRVWVNPDNPEESVRINGVVPANAIAAVLQAMFTGVTGWYLIQSIHKGERFLANSPRRS